MDHSRRRPRRGGALRALQVSRSPFAAAAPSVLVAVGYALTVLVWLAAGDQLPGGRWLAVHLFTLGVLTNLVLTFSEHFSRTLTHTPGERPAWWPLVTNAGILLVLVSLPSSHRVGVTIGSTVVAVSVVAALRRIRSMRRGALGARFSWIVRAYEHAHAMFLLGVALGALLGIGGMSGAWYGAGRLAHLHANVLGWGVLTLLATLVFFGPSMARTRIEPGADRRARPALAVGAGALLVAVAALVAMGAGGATGTPARLVAAAGLAVFGGAATIVCLPVVRAVRQRPGAAAPLVVAASTWLVVLLWADALVIATASWHLLDALGVAVLGGVLAQAILATLLYLSPMLRAGSARQRAVVQARVDTLAHPRAVVFNLGIALVVASTTVAPDPAVLAVGWGLVGIVVIGAAVTVALPAHAPEET